MLEEKKMLRRRRNITKRERERTCFFHSKQIDETNRARDFKLNDSDEMSKIICERYERHAFEWV